MPAHLNETLWTPVAKKQGANTMDSVRDLEIPLEDTKLLERALSLLLDECAAEPVRTHNEALSMEATSL